MNNAAGPWPKPTPAFNSSEYENLLCADIDHNAAMHRTIMETIFFIGILYRLQDTIFFSENQYWPKNDAELAKSPVRRQKTP
jgi:hypothetical protein